LNENHNAVAEQVSAEDSRTVGITSSSHASSLFNYDRGFDTFYDNPSYRPNAIDTTSLSLTSRIKYALFNAVSSVPIINQVGSAVLDATRKVQTSTESKAPYERAEVVTDKAIGLLQQEVEAYPGKDRFIWIHYMEPHAPYYPPEDIVAEFGTDGFSLGAVNELWDRWKENRPPLWKNKDNSRIFTESERRALQLFYRIQIRYLDQEVERLFKYIDTNIGFDSTALLFTSDHGEEFFDHGDLGHRPKPYDELIHVPLLAYSEAFESTTVHQTVSHVDLGPTVTDLLEGTNAENWRGQSLLPLLEPSPESEWDSHEYVLSELSHTSGYGGNINPNKAIISIITNDWKYIHNEQIDSRELYPRDAAEIEAYECAEEESIVEELREIATDRLAEISKKEVDKGEISEDLRDQLHQLGYIDE
jgi:arylsulfatase A-like enzyme